MLASSQVAVPLDLVPPGPPPLELYATFNDLVPDVENAIVTFSVTYVEKRTVTYERPYPGGVTKLETVTVHSPRKHWTTAPLNAIRVYDVNLAPVAPERVARLLKGANVLVSRDGEVVDRRHLRDVRQDTLIVVIPEWKTNRDLRMLRVDP
jgi:hypothetical protein